MRKSVLKSFIAACGVAVALTTVGCSGGGGGIGGSIGGSSSSIFGGGGGKGPFKQGSTVIAYKLTDGVRVADTNATTTTSDDTGKFSFGTSITWSGATEFLIYGDYLNENTGTYMNLAADKALRAVADAAKGSVFINVLTNIAAPGIIESLKQNVPIATASAQAQENVAKLFNITLDAGVELTDLDVTNTTSNTTANSQLLLVSAAVLNTANPEQVMEQLAEDMSDGEVDDSALGDLEELKQEAAAINIEEVATKMAEANIGVQQLNVVSAFDGLLAFDHNISFTKQNDAYTSTVYTSNEATVEKVQGTSAAAISVSGGSYSIDGGAFVTTAGTITNGQKVRVRGTSSASYVTSTPVTLTIGGGKIVFDIVTESNPFVADTTPNTFTFGYKKDQAKNAVNVTSDTITITGINAATPISVTDGEMSIQGGGWTTAATNIANNQTVAVRHNASANGGTQVKTTVTVGDINGTFSSFTVVDDTTPDQFTFTDVNDVNKTATSTVDSNTITIAGINTAADIKIVGGEYKINGGAFTDANASAAVSNGGTLTLRATPSDSFNTTTTVTVTVGNVLGAFKVKTMSDPFVADSTPNAFSFASQLGQQVSTNVDANMTVSGINVAVPVTITNGTYVVNGGSQDANVSNGDVITVTQTTSDAFDTEKVTTLTVGGVSSTFKTKTIIEDKTPDTFSFDTNGSIAVDTEATSNTITIAGLSAGSAVPISIVNGTYEVNAGGYTAVAGTVQNNDTVTVKQTSASTQGTSNVTTLTVGNTVRSFTTITAKNAPAISGTPAATAAEDALYSFQATEDNTSGEIISWSIANKPSWANFNTVNGLLSGTPTNDDVATYADINITATNEIGEASIALFSIEVTNTNDAPEANSTTATTNEDTAVDVNTTALISDVDVGDTYSLDFTQGTNGTVTNANGILTYTPALNFFGTDTFTFSAKDEANATATGTVSVTINSVNDIAVLGGTIAGTIAEGATSISNVVTIADPDAGEAALQAKENVAGMYGIFNVAANGTWTYTLTDSPTIQALNVGETLSDGIRDVNSSDNTATTDLNVTITGVNDAPVAEATQTYAIKKLTDLNVTLSGTDVDNGAVLTLTSATATNATVTILDPAAGTITFNAPNDTNGPLDYTLNYTFKDEHNATVSGTHTITVSLSDAPVANNDTATTDEDIDVVINVTANDTDDNNAITSVEIVTQPAHGTVSISDLNITYSPNDNYNGADSFVYKTIDQDGGFDNADVNITINAINDAPTAVADAKTVFEDSNATTNAFNVTLNDSDIDGDDFNVTAVSNPANGTVTIDLDNKSVKYAPSANYNGTDSFIYTISDGTLETNATVTITVTPVNDSIVWNSTSEVLVDTDEDFVPLTVDLLATDVDGNITYSAQDTTGKVSLSINAATNVMTISPVLNAYGDTNITVTGEQGGETSTHAIALTILPVNDAPVITSLQGNQTTSTTGVVTISYSAIDVDDTNLTVSVSATSGTAVVTSATNINFTPVNTFGTTTSTITLTVADSNTSVTQQTTVANTISPTLDAGGMTEGMAFHDIENWDGLTLYKATLGSSGDFISEIFTPNASGTFNVAKTDDDLVLVNSVWVNGDTYWNSLTYTIDNGNVVLSDANGIIEYVRIGSEIDLANPSGQEALTILETVNALVPGDVNVSFSSGASAYMLESFRTKELYEIFSPVTHYETNATYSTMQAFLDSNLTVVGVETASGWMGIDFERDGNGVVINFTGQVDNNGTLVMYNPNSRDVNQTVGTWKLITLPTSANAIVFTPDENATEFFGDSDKMLTLYNSTVYSGSYQPISTAYESNSGDVELNTQAFNDIQDAVEAYYAGIALSKQVAASVSGKSITFTTDSMQATFAVDGSYYESGNDGQAWSCSGKWSVSSSGIIGATCEDAGTSNLPTFTESKVVADNEFWITSITNTTVSIHASDLINGTEDFTLTIAYVDYDAKAINAFSDDFIASGVTLYNVYKNFENNVWDTNFSAVTMHFENGQLQVVEGLSSSFVHTFIDVEVLSNGMLRYFDDFDGNVNRYINIVGSEDGYVRVCYASDLNGVSNCTANTDSNEYLFVNATKAQNYMNANLAVSQKIVSIDFGGGETMVSAFHADGTYTEAGTDPVDGNFTCYGKWVPTINGEVAATCDNNSSRPTNEDSDIAADKEFRISNFVSADGLTGTVSLTFANDAHNAIETENSVGFTAKTISTIDALATPASVTIGSFTVKAYSSTEVASNLGTGIFVVFSVNGTNEVITLNPAHANNGSLMLQVFDNSGNVVATTAYLTIPADSETLTFGEVFNNQ